MDSIQPRQHPHTLAHRLNPSNTPTHETEASPQHPDERGDPTTPTIRIASANPYDPTNPRRTKVGEGEGHGPPPHIPPPKDLSSRCVTQLLLRGTLREPVPIFSTTTHFYNCIYYVRAAPSNVLEVLICYSIFSFSLWHRFTAHGVMLL